MQYEPTITEPEQMEENKQLIYITVADEEGRSITRSAVAIDGALADGIEVVVHDMVDTLLDNSGAKKFSC